LYGEGYTIRGVQRILREQSTAFVQAVWQEGAPQPPHGASEEEDFADETVTADEVVDEPRGIRGKLSSLIGRDLGDRGETAEDRREPPLRSAPMPRIEPADRAIHGVAGSEPALPAHEVPPSSAARPAGPALARDDLRKLHAALHELAECRKLIDGALAA
jgi:hypothetical protein